MRNMLAVFLAFAGMVLMAPWAPGAVPEPLFTWPGDARPMERSVHIARDDYPMLKELTPVVRHRGGWHALSGMTFSAWLNIPKGSRRSYNVVRFNSVPGTGTHEPNSFSLWIEPNEANGYDLCVSRSDDRGGARVVLPDDAPGRWVHVAFSVAIFPRDGTPEVMPCTVAIDGKSRHPPVVNTLQNGVASIVLGDARLGMNRVALYTKPLCDTLSPAEVARVPIARATEPTEWPTPPHHWLCGEPGERLNWITAHHLLPEGGNEHLRTPSGEGTSVRYYSTRSSVMMNPLAIGNGYTVVVVGKFGRTPGSVLLSLGLGGKGCSPWEDHIRLERGDGSKVVLLTNSKRVSFTPIEVSVPDASTAFHCYAISHDRDALTLWVDGTLQGSTALTEPLASQLNTASLQLGTVFGMGAKASRPGADAKNFVVDDLKVYGKVLSPREHAYVAGLQKIDGRPPRGGAAATAESAPTVIATVPTDDSLKLPTLEAGHAIPSAASQAKAKELLDELLAGEEPEGKELLALVPESENDAGRFLLLGRAEEAFAKRREHEAVFAVMALREAAFPGAVENATVEAHLKEALRDTAVKTPDKAIGHARTALDFALANARPKLRDAIQRLTKQIERHLKKSDAYADWERALSKAERELKDRAALAKLKKDAEDGDPEAAMRYAKALIKADSWGDDTLGALAASGDAQLLKLATDESLLEEGDKATALALGERWWDYAESCKDADFAAACRRHSADLYEVGRETVTGLKGRLIDKRIEAARGN